MGARAAGPAGPVAVDVGACWRTAVSSCAATCCGPWAHWITPEFEPRRFDARFFVAALPDGQHARDVSSEADEASWVTVRHAVAEHEAGRMAMLPPTIAALRDLAPLGDLDAVLAAPRELRPVMPRLVEDADGLRLEVP